MLNIFIRIILLQ